MKNLYFGAPIHEKPFTNHGLSFADVSLPLFVLCQGRGERLLEDEARLCTGSARESQMGMGQTFSSLRVLLSIYGSGSTLFVQLLWEILRNLNHKIYECSDGQL